MMAAMDDNKLLTTVIVLILGGVLGGIAGYIIERREFSTNGPIDFSSIRESGKPSGLAHILSKFGEQSRTVSGSIIIGIAAALITPLFLEVLSAGGPGLITRIFLSDNQQPIQVSFLLLLSYVTIFSIFAQRFISAAYGQLIRRVESAATSRATEAALETASELAAQSNRTIYEDLLMERESAISEIDTISDERRAILFVIADAPSALEASEIAQKLGRTKREVEIDINELINLNLIKKLQKTTGSGYHLRLSGLSYVKMARKDDD
jgi:predicted transcriptional regulator